MDGAHAHAMWTVRLTTRATPAAVDLTCLGLDRKAATRTHTSTVHSLVVVTAVRTTAARTTAAMRVHRGSYVESRALELS